MTQFAIKRVYLPVSPDDGYRVLVDRLWPRGLTKEEVHYDLWDKDLAPSPELREWFHVDRDGRWDEFVKRYIAELTKSGALDRFVASVSAYPKVTLLYASKDADHNQADILLSLLQKRS